MTTPSGPVVSMRDTFGEHLLEIGARDPRVVILDADLASSTRTMAFSARYPNRAVNVGIAEQDMVGIAAGLALGGLVPFVNTFAAFLTRRAADQIALSIAYPQLNVKLFGFHAGINLGEDGATQQAVEDLAIMRGIPGLRVYAPIDARDLEFTMDEVAALAGPTYTRLARFPSPILCDAPAGSGFRQLSDGNDLTVLTCGSLSAGVLDAAASLRASGVAASVVAVTRLKPLDARLAAWLAARPEVPLAVVEEHNIYGGLADAVSALLDAEGLAHRLERIGLPDRFGESGPPAVLLEAFDLSGRALVNRLGGVLRREGKGVGV